VVIKNESLRKALNVIHDGFFLSKYKEMHLFIAGTGFVGSCLIKQLQKQHDIFILLIFVSNSGKRFALAQAEETPFVMAPWDRPKIWKALFTVLKPSATVVVRYELWPGFLNVAQSMAPLYLIDAVSSPKLERRGPAQYLRKQLISHFTRIFVVGPIDQQFFTQHLGQCNDKVLVVGDTKYDRVLERRQQRERQKQELGTQLDSFLGNSQLVIILGSAWPADLEVLLSVYPQLLKL
jgi:3-deoxy-D-manno-octulosonic-acid transferase